MTIDYSYTLLYAPSVRLSHPLWTANLDHEVCPYEESSLASRLPPIVPGRRRGPCRSSALGAHRGSALWTRASQRRLRSRLAVSRQGRSALTACHGDSAA